MARIAAMTLQTIWDCRWSRPGYLPRGLAEEGWPDGLWVCARPTGGTKCRAVSEDECAACPHWQAVLPDEHEHA